MKSIRLSLRDRDMGLPENSDFAVIASLSAFTRLRQELEVQERTLVQRLRKGGVTWRTIGRAYGVSPSAAHQRFVGRRLRRPNP